MSAAIPVGIAGLGSYAPERVVPNSYFEDRVDTSDEWIVQRTGIRERRWVAEGENTSHMCVAAARRALEAASIDARELDMIVIGTVSPDQYVPACAPLVQRAIGASNAVAWDVNSACTGFLTALDTASAFIASGRVKRALVLGAETLSRFIDMDDRASCILFGDAAGAAVVMPHADCGQGEILKLVQGCDGTGYEFIQMPAGGSREPASTATVAAHDHALRVRGREVFRFAVERMGAIVREMLAGHDLAQLGLIVPHQVNKRIIDAALGKLDVPPEKIVVNIERYGNTSAASIPLALDEAWREGRLEQDKLVVMAAFGAGLTWGGALLRW